MSSERIRTTIETWRENGAWHATERDAESKIEGRGPTAPLAVRSYAEAIEAAADDPREVPADD